MPFHLALFFSSGLGAGHCSGHSSFSISYVNAFVLFCVREWCPTLFMCILWKTMSDAIRSEYETKYSRMGQVKFVKDSLQNILLSPFLNILSYMWNSIFRVTSLETMENKDSCLQPLRSQYCKHHSRSGSVTNTFLNFNLLNNYYRTLFIE